MSESPEPDDIELARLEQEKAVKESQLNYRYPQDDEITQLRKRIAELEANKTEQKNRNYHLRDEIAQIERDQKVVQSRIELRREKERQAAELIKQTEQFDRITAGAKWRLGITDSKGEVKKIMAHQIFAAHFMATAKRVICADEMGLGKTIETIATLDMLEAKRILIVCPGEVLSGFRQEIKRWANRPVLIIGRRPKAEVFNLLRMLKDTDAEEFCLLVNYEAWARNKKLLSVFESMQFDTVVCDEAHRIKETDTSAYKGVEQVVNSKNTCQECQGWVTNGKCFGEMCAWPNPQTSVENLILLTGTPILNRPTEIYSLLNLISPSIFYSKKHFLRMFCYQPDPYGRPNDWVFRDGGMAMLADKIQGMYIRRTLDDTDIKLPPQDIRIHEIELNEEDYPKQCEIYEQISKYAQIMIDDDPAMDQMSQLAILMRLRQAVVWPGGINIKVPETWPDGSYCRDFEGKIVYKEQTVGDHFRESVKLDRTMEMLQEYVSEGKRVVIFSQFAEVIRELLRRCEHAGIRAASYFGDTKEVDRLAVKRNFDRDVGEEPKWDVVICHYTTGGVGLNFTAATRMIFTDEEWNPGKEDQAMKRISRIGQTENTIIDILRVNGTIDTWLADLIASKRMVISDFNNQNDIYKEIRMMLYKGRVKSDD